MNIGNLVRRYFKPVLYASIRASTAHNLAIFCTVWLNFNLNQRICCSSGTINLYTYLRFLCKRVEKIIQGLIKIKNAFYGIHARMYFDARRW